MNDSIIFLVLAALALVFKWLTGRGEGERDQPAPPSPNERAERRPAVESEEERVRRFLEALGMPQGSAPPPPVQPRRVTPRVPRAETAPKAKRSWVQPLPPVVTTPPEIFPPPLPSEPVPVPVARMETPPAPEIVVVAPASAPEIAPRRRAPATSLGAVLRSRGSMRQAIILREVLGPPRGLEPFAP